VALAADLDDQPGLHPWGAATRPQRRRGGGDASGARNGCFFRNVRRHGVWLVPDARVLCGDYLVHRAAPQQARDDRSRSRSRLTSPFGYSVTWMRMKRLVAVPTGTVSRTVIEVGVFTSMIKPELLQLSGCERSLLACT